MTGSAQDYDIDVTRDGEALELRLSGRFTLESGVPDGCGMAESDMSDVKRVCLIDAGIVAWDSALLLLVVRATKQCSDKGITLDLSGVPAGARRLIALASAVPEREGARHGKATPSVLARLGEWAMASFKASLDAVTFLGEALCSIGHFMAGRARYRKGEFWLIIEQCGPQALGIVTTISVLVGAILAFVGAVQLKMFGAEIYVANLVGLGMVMEMGALMTGIILAGRTGASFAAQLGTMQVNEEIDALRTMGIPPMDYLVMPRIVALALMTPLLVIYADILGILGGAFVGIVGLGLSPTVYFEQTIELMTLWHCAQGLIKGSTFGVLIAICGCMRGLACGRSASAVGEAATSAVVTAIVMIVLADALWTFMFMVLE